MKIIDETETQYNKIKEKTFAVENSEQSTELNADTKETKTSNSSVDILKKIEAVKPHFTRCKLTNKQLKFYIPDFKRNLRLLTSIHVESKEEIDALIDKIVEIMNCCFSRATIGGDTCILKYKRVKNKTGLALEIFTLEQFKKLFSNVSKVKTGIDKKDNYVLSDIATLWFKNRKANDAYNGIDLYPDLEPLVISENWFNLWQGWGVNDVLVTKTDVQLVAYLNHIKFIICDNNQEHYEELLRFLAHWRQRPYEKPLYAIVLESQEHGTGKSTFLQPLLTLSGSHGTEIHKSSSVTGRFNTSLANKVFAVLEEAFAGSSEATNIMKNLVTSLMLELEYKNKDKIEVSNYLRLILTTNQDHILKIDLTERRYLYLKVSPLRLKDDPYFDTLKFTRTNNNAHLEFTSKLSYFLNNYKIDKDYLPKNPPETPLLAEKKLNNLSTENQFVYFILHNEVNTSSGKWASRLSNSEILDYYSYVKKLLKTNKNNKESDNPQITIGIIFKEIGIRQARVGGGRGRTFEVERIQEYKKRFCAFVGLNSDIFS